ncbi:beta-N-acetylhexosaminidase [Tessaracoccus oleiagri]|uniref:beta-N-acetylhexosaminidase n=1 Tax=Tessaracoccus oleiagri TaxID=686624 RepID=A0A1G9JFF7_9ACTN|nr:beta-N-acetylhexosaminidase [Tessaracoccus oleiagri]SDL35995.1 hexosaminidase [Tessaracoccus oleiagri]
MRLLPTPSVVRWGTGEFVLPDPLPISGGGPARGVLAERLLVAAGVRSAGAAAGERGVRFEVDASLEAEAYRLTVDEHGVRIVHGDDAGAGWAVQTLLQLLPVFVHGPGPMEAADLRVPFVEIEDRPRYAWRGSLVDVARHFLPMEGLLKHLEVMAMHKLNVLHLHLTDDQGWRLPVAKYPLLTEVGGWRPGTLPGHQPPPDENDCDDFPQHDGRPHGGSYTVEEIGRLVARAGELGITVVPEVDMPGHMEAAIAAYPWLGACDHVRHPRTCWGISEHVLRLSEETLQFCRDVLDEVMRLFPGSPIHVGGDECPGSEWLADPVSRATMAEVGADGPAAAQAWFEREVCRHVLDAGRRVIAWDEVLDGGVPEGTTVMVWRDRRSIQRAARLGHDVIAAPGDLTYLDHSQFDGDGHPLAITGPTTLATVAGLSEELDAVDGPEAARLLGGQFQLWTEYIHDWRRLEYFAWPRGSSIAQQLWAGHPAESGHVDGLGRHLDRLTAAGVNWCRPPRHESH